MSHSIRTLVFAFAGVIGAGLASAALAQTPTHATYRMSWGTCEPQVVDMPFQNQSSAVLIFSLADLTPVADDFFGLDFSMTISPQAGNSYPDAWRFDAQGCQTDAGMIVESAGYPADCPRVASPAEGFTYHGPDQNVSTFRLIHNWIGSPFSPQAGVRYGLWKVTFDMSAAVAGPGTPGATCGGAETPITIRCEEPYLYRVHGLGNVDFLQPAQGDVNYVTWNAAPPVATEPRTWGAVKALYRMKSVR